MSIQEQAKQYLADLFSEVDKSQSILLVIEDGVILCKLIAKIQQESNFETSDNDKQLNINYFMEQASDLLPEMNIQDNAINSFNDDNINFVCQIISNLAKINQIGNYELFNKSQHQQEITEVDEQLADTKNNESSIVQLSNKSEISQNLDMDLKDSINQVSSTSENNIDNTENHEEILELENPKEMKLNDLLQQFDSNGVPIPFLVKDQVQLSPLLPPPLSKRQNSISLSQLIDTRVESFSISPDTQVRYSTKQYFEKFNEILADLQIKKDQKGLRYIGYPIYTWLDHGEIAFSRWIDKMDNKPLKLSFKSIKLTSQPQQVDFEAVNLSFLVEMALSDRYFSQILEFQIPMSNKHDKFLVKLPTVEFENSKQLFQKHLDFKLSQPKETGNDVIDIDLTSFDEEIREKILLFFLDHVSSDDFRSIQLDNFDPKISLQSANLLINTCTVLNYVLDKTQRTIIFNQSTSEIVGTHGQSKIKSFFNKLLKK
ncbi:hypothetical protein SS50377_26625 [Spironucleus salmonicida]|uniref:Uncharacterized protein n=1 Tax=Spironucleus salmonicida TaxID=348837 RepID=V6LAN2_9EUKA|nr:hypothetical protein SS50377_26625 [Spironucleus salmonicida]|eukprot:EST41472.1 Hypothetical protein SS50377_19197 [Spironucleus salmonicida]